MGFNRYGNMGKIIIKGKTMKCPKCGNEMEKGEVQVGDIFEAKFRSGGPVLWIPEEDGKKLLPKKTIRLDNVGEGYYCEKCAKVVAMFDEKGVDFFQ